MRWPIVHVLARVLAGGAPRPAVRAGIALLAALLLGVHLGGTPVGPAVVALLAPKPCGSYWINPHSSTRFWE